MCDCAVSDYTTKEFYWSMLNLIGAALNLSVF